MKYIWLITFLVLPLIGSSYTAWRIWHVLPFANGWRWAAIALFVVLFCSMFIGFSGAIENMPLDMATVAYEVGNSFIFILLYLVMIFLALDLGRLLHLVPKAWLVGNGNTSLGILAVITDALYEKTYGLLKKGNTLYYVSSGMGIWGGKFRIGTQSEYVVLNVNAHR